MQIKKVATDQSLTTLTIIIEMTKINTYRNKSELNFKLSDFTGCYSNEITESPKYFTNPETGLTFKLCERKEPTPLRPKYYLMQRVNGNVWNYLTSFYPKIDCYIAEIQRNYFIVNFTDKGGFCVTSK